MKKDLTVRGIVVGCLGCVLITCSSMYSSLRMGALPWPTAFVTVLSMAVLSALGKTSFHEINVTHTIMSSGAMVGGALAFTLPGLWMADPGAGFPFGKFIVLSMAGSLLGSIFTYLNKDKLLEQPFPIGTSASQTLEVGLNKGKTAIWLFASFSFAAVFCVFRDALGLIPSVLIVFGGTLLMPALVIWLSPMALGIGSIIGPKLSLFWLGSSLLANYALVPLLQVLFHMQAHNALVFKENLGLGLMIGTGGGILIKLLWSMVGIRRTSGKMNMDKTRIILLVCAVIIMALVVVFTDIGIVDGLIVLLGISIVTNLSGMLTGQTGVNPMEIFGILVLLACSLKGRPSATTSFSITAIVAVSCGLGGGVLNDLKSGKLLGTDSNKQIIGEAIGGIVGAIAAVFALYFLKNAFGGFGTDFFPAPQANAVRTMVDGLGNPTAFFIGIAIALALYLLGLPAATVGLGVYLSINISSIVGIGSFVSLLAISLCKDKQEAKTKINLIGSGLLGGEGTAGVIIALIMVARLS